MRPQARDVRLISTTQDWESAEIEILWLYLVSIGCSHIVATVEAFKVDMINQTRSIAFRSTHLCW